MQLVDNLKRLFTISGEFISLIYDFKVRYGKNNEKNRKIKARLLRESLERLGSVFIKFGQLLALRPDLIPKEYCHELFYLLENVPPFGKDDIDKIFVEEFGKVPVNIFKDFRYYPIGSASFGQVHEAYLKTGEKVAIKIQRPNIEKIVKRDIFLLKLFAGITDTVSFSPNKLINSVKEFEIWTQEELDYIQEGKYTDEFYHRTKNSYNVIKTPKLYGKYTTKRIITQQFIEGFTINKYLIARRKKDVEFLNKAKGIGFSEKEVANKILINGIKQVYLDGYFHADQHPANIIFSKNKKLYYIDFGIVGTLTKEQRMHHLRYTRSCIIGDTETAFKELLSLCNINYYPKLDKLKEEHNKLLKNILESTKNSKLNFPQLGVFLIETLKLLNRYNLKLPNDRLRYFRALITLQSIIYEIYPQIEMEEVNRKFMTISLANLIESLPKIIEKMNWQKELLKWINMIEEKVDD